MREHRRSIPGLRAFWEDSKMPPAYHCTLSQPRMLTRVHLYACEQAFGQPRQAGIRLRETDRRRAGRKALSHSTPTPTPSPAPFHAPPPAPRVKLCTGNCRVRLGAGLPESGSPFLLPSSRSLLPSPPPLPPSPPPLAVRPLCASGQRKGRGQPSREDEVAGYRRSLALPSSLLPNLQCKGIP